VSDARHFDVPNYEEIRDTALRLLPANFRNPLIGQGLACEVCSAPIDGLMTRCDPCLRQRNNWTGQLADIVIPLSYAGSKNPQARQDLWLYKNSDHPEVSRLALNRLSYLIWYALVHHGPCLEAILGPVEVVTSVPSGKAGKRPDGHPLEQLTFYPTQPTRVHLVRTRDAVERVVHPDSIEVAGSLAVNGKHVLVIDDTWTTGASTQAAAVALRRAGAARVSVVVIGRWLNTSWGPTEQFLHARPADELWSPEVCPVTRGTCPTPS